MNEEKMNETFEETPRPAQPKVKKVKLVPMRVDNCSRVNVRLDPDKDADVVKTLDRGTIVYTDPSLKYDDYVAVKESGEVVGFIKKDFVTAV